jgi:hypothetical protein
MNDKSSSIALDDQDLRIIEAVASASPGDFPITKSDCPVSK